MSPTSSSAADWSTLLEPVPRLEDVLSRQDTPLLGEIVVMWHGDEAAFRAGRAVLIGFPQDEGVRRNHGRPGAAQAPQEIRRWLHRLVPCDVQSGVDLRSSPPVDVGNVRVAGSLEETQAALGKIVAAVLQTGAVPIVLGGGHETAYGHYLGYASQRKPVGIINIDAHLDVRPLTGGLGNSGTPFRQMMEHPDWPLPGAYYVCLGAQPAVTSREHWHYAQQKGCVVRWREEIGDALEQCYVEAQQRLAAAGCQVYMTIDADAFQVADVPGVSAPNPLGLVGTDVMACARLAGRFPKVSSLDVVEINPLFDRDGQSARWAALVVWHFLMGLAERSQ